MFVDIEFDSGAVIPLADVMELAQIAEAKNFNTVWGGEANNKDPIIMLAGIAARTKKVKLGTAIYHIFGRSPVSMAIMSATLEELSQGRFLVGFGVSNPHIARWHGATFEKPVRAMREYIELFRKAYAGEKLSYHGEFFSSENFKLAFSAPGPSVPIYVGTLGPQMARMAGRLCDGVIINMAVPSEVRRIGDVARQGAKEAGRDPATIEVVCKLRCSLNDDLEAARRPLRQIAAYYCLPDFYRDMMARVGFADTVERMRQVHREKGFRAAMELISNDMLNELPTVAAQSIEPIRERLARFEAAGASRVIISYVPCSDDVAAETRRFLDIF